MVLAEILEVELTKLANAGYTQWHNQVDVVAQQMGRIRMQLEELLK